MDRRRLRDGFTIIELFVVIAIIALFLTGISHLTFARLHRRVLERAVERPETDTATVAF